MNPHDALKLIPVTPEEVARWMAECDAGLHLLPADIEDKLQKSWEALQERIWPTDQIVVTE